MKFQLFILYIFTTTAWCQNNINYKGGTSLDTTITYGSLPNGFSYYIKPLQSAGKKINMDLVIGAGSRVEEPEQIDLSHAVEHLAFRSTENFPLGISNHPEMLSKAGVEGLGRGFYAFNGFYSTHYTFFANRDNPESIKLGLRWYKDVATGLELTEQDIDKERISLIQELEERIGSNLMNFIAERKLYNNIFPCRFSYENYREHMISFEPEVLRKYYEDWYRPHLMSLIVVGDIKNIPDLEKQIRATFGTIPNDTGRMVRNCDSLYFSSPNQFSVVARKPKTLKDSLNNTIQFNLFFRDSNFNSDVSSLYSAKRSILWELVIKTLNKRLESLRNNYSNNIIAAGINLKKYKALPTVYKLQIDTRIKDESHAISKSIEYIRQLKDYGMVVAEWEALKEEYLTNLTSYNLQQPRYWIQQINNNYLHQEALPIQKHEQLITWFKGLSVEDFNNSIKEFFANEPEDIGVIVPPGLVSRYNEKQVREWVQNSYRSTIVPFAFPKTPTELIGEDEIAKLAPKTIVYAGQGKSGAKEYILENGLKVILKTTQDMDGEEEEILFQAFSKKGASCYPEEEIPSATNAVRIIKHAGIGDLNKFELERYINTNLGSKFRIHPYIDYKETGIEGSTTKEHFENFLQLVYLYFNRPRKDITAFKDWREKESRNFLEVYGNLHNTDFNNGVEDFLLNGNVTFQMGTQHYLSIKEADFDQAYKIFNELFSNARDFTVVISGNRDLETELPLLQKYLGNLPNVQISQCDLKEVNIKIPDGPAKIEIPLSAYNERSNYMYSMRYISQATSNENWKEKIKIEALGEILQELAWALRMDEGFGVYQVFAGEKYRPREKQYDLYIKLDCLPSELEAIQEETEKIFLNISNGLVEEGMFKMVMDRLYSKYAKESTDKNLQQINLVNHYRYGTPWVEIDEALEFIESLDLQDIIKVASFYLTKENQYQFIMAN